MTEERCTFRITGWKEDALEGAPKLSRATVTQAYQGAIQGTGALEYVMSYAPDGAATFVGIERITGTVLGKTGSCVLRHNGAFAAGVASSAFEVLPGRGTGALAGLVGGGTFEARHGEPGEVALRLAFEA